MLYEVELPDETRELLTELVIVQCDVIEATLEISRLGIADWKERFQELLKNQLDQCTYVDTYRARVVSWICNKSKLLEALHCFAEGCEEPSPNNNDLYKEKQWLLQAIQRDITRLAGDQAGVFEVYLNEKSGLPPELSIARNFIAHQTNGRRDKRPEWLKALIEYFLYFYEDLGSNTGIQHDIFRDRSENYSRQNFLKAYTDQNPSLAVCPMCDNAAFLTISSKGHYHADIEHYFPKDIYPHLAVHPYNLIPVCKLCNQAIKRDIDPLAPDQAGDNRYSLGDIFLPYRPSRALSTASVLLLNSVTTVDGNEHAEEDYVFRTNRDGSREQDRLKSVRIALHVRTGDGRDLTNQFKLFRRIYDIPGRWEQQIDEICDMFFRRIRQLFADNIALEPDSLDSIKLIENKLNWLLVFLDDTGGSDRYTFLMKWWLAELVVRYVNQETPTVQNPLLEEIKSWKDDFENTREMYAQRVTGLTNEVRILIVGDSL